MICPWNTLQINESTNAMLYAHHNIIQDLEKV